MRRREELVTAARRVIGRDGFAAATVGTITPGKDADIIAVDGDPLTNVRLLESVAFVMKHGHVYKAGGKPQVSD